CACITGRADLAFMASDYKVEVLNPSTVDLSALGDRLKRGSSNAVAQIKVLKDQVDSLETASDDLAAQYARLPDNATVEERDVIVEAQKQADDTQKEVFDQLTEARRKYAEETGGPIQVVETGALEDRVAALKLGLEEAKKEKAELEEKQLTTAFTTTKEARVK